VRRVAAVLLLALAAFAARAESVIVIVNPDHAHTVINRALLRGLFDMQITQWPDGAPARVFVLDDDNGTHLRFCRELLGTFPYVLRRAWDRRVYTGTGLAPTLVHSEAEMREVVLATPGAIGYLSAGKQPVAATGIRSASLFPAGRAFE
jgi:ABC-type phosphate transport system substrate-binding protein